MALLPPPYSLTAKAIDDAAVASARDGDSAGVAMSEVGHECRRYLWYRFRWAAQLEKPEGQQQRRFETGNLYETRLLSYLRAIGCDVQEVDEATGKQLRAELAGGHLRGKLDGIATGLPEAPKSEHVVECKSHNDKSFKVLVKMGLREGKPDHYAQTQLYMHYTGIQRGLYISINKNDEAIYCERISYDPGFCAALEIKVERVVEAARPPARLHDDPDSKAAFQCGWCKARPQCHERAFARRNCRTCIHSTPHDGPRWTCDRHDRELDYKAQQAGCGDHLYIPELVPGRQVDADPEAGTITYKMPDGASWTDGQAARP